MSDDYSVNFTYGLEDDEFDTEGGSVKDSESLKPVQVHDTNTGPGDMLHNTLDFDYDEYNATSDTFVEPVDVLKSEEETLHTNTVDSSEPRFSHKKDVELSDDYELIDEDGLLEEEEEVGGPRFGIQLGARSQYINDNSPNDNNHNGHASVKDEEDDTMMDTIVDTPLQLPENNTSVIDIDTSTLLHTYQTDNQETEQQTQHVDNSTELNNISMLENSYDLNENSPNTKENHMEPLPLPQKDIETSYNYTTDPLYSSAEDDTNNVNNDNTNNNTKEDTSVIVNTPTHTKYNNNNDNNGNNDNNNNSTVYPPQKPIARQQQQQQQQQQQPQAVRSNNSHSHMNNTNNNNNTNNKNTSALTQAIEYSLQLSEDLETLRVELEKAYLEKDQVIRTLQTEKSRNKENEVEKNQLRLNVDKAYDEWSEVLADLQRRCATLQDQIIPAHEMDVLRAAIIAEIEAPYVSRLDSLISQQDKQNSIVHEKETALQLVSTQLMEREALWKGAMERLHSESQQRVDKQRAERHEVQGLLDKAIQGDMSAAQDRELQNSRTKLLHLERANEDLSKDIGVLTRDMHRVRSESTRTNQGLEAEVAKLSKMNELLIQRQEILRSEVQKQVESTLHAQEETSKHRSEISILSSELSECRVEKEQIEASYRLKLETWVAEQTRVQKEAHDMQQYKELELLRLQGNEDVLKRNMEYMQQLHGSEVREVKKQLELIQIQKEGEVDRLKKEQQDSVFHQRDVEVRYASKEANRSLSESPLNEMDTQMRQQVLSNESRVRELQDRVSSRDRELVEMQARLAGEQRLNVELSGLLQKKEQQEDTYTASVLEENRRLHMEVAAQRLEGNAAKEEVKMQAQQELLERAKMERHQQGIAQRAEQRMEQLQAAKERYKCLYLQSTSQVRTVETRNQELQDRIAALEAHQSIKQSNTPSQPASQKALLLKSKLQSALNRQS